MVNNHNFILDKEELLYGKTSYKWLVPSFITLDTQLYMYVHMYTEQMRYLPAASCSSMKELRGTQLSLDEGEISSQNNSTCLGPKFSLHSVNILIQSSLNGISISLYFTLFQISNYLHMYVVKATGWQGSVWWTQASNYGNTNKYL